MSEKRRDNRNRILREGEYQRKDGRYRFRYLDEDGKEQNVYSWRLDRNDPMPKGKRREPSLREKELKLDAVAVSSGPGSYTGLRIGVSVAKGLCFGYGIPLISIPTLEVLAVAALEQQNNASDCLYCAMLDARRMEVYATIYDVNLKTVRETSADIVDAETYASWLEKGKVCFFGNGAAKCREVITSPNALFIDNIHPLAVNMITLSEKAFAGSQFEDVAYFEPFYLKEFQATIAKNKVLG